MKTKALKAWLASLPLALLSPVVIWICFAAFTSDFEPYDLRLLVLPGYSQVAPLVIHFIAYLITGLPIFLLQVGKPNSIIWKLPGALIMGGGLGALVFVILRFEKFSYIGAAYGFITAIAAYRQRPIPT